MNVNMKGIIKFFDHLEDHIRGYFSRMPIGYAFIGGVVMVLFWRGVWQTGDILEAKGGIIGFLFYEPVSVIWTTIIMLLIGLFVSFFIGESILISGLKQEKKIADKTEKEVEEEESQINRIENKISKIETEISELKDDLEKKEDNK
jgi:mannitol-specific phosphotransferase system IIBC component